VLIDILRSRLGAATQLTRSDQSKGCDAFVAKPYSPRQLLARIREYLSAEVTR
jgi:hypothetical protein